jgi:hypothetical protein
MVLGSLRGHVDRLLATVPFLVFLLAFGSQLGLRLERGHHLHGVVILRT